MARRYSGKDLLRAIDCVNAVVAGDVKMLASRRQAAATALADYIFELDDPGRALFIERALGTELRMALGVEVVEYVDTKGDGKVHIRKCVNAPTAEPARCGKRNQATVTSAWGFWGPGGEGFKDMCPECVAAELGRPA